MASMAAPAFGRLASADAPQYAFKLHHAFSAVSGVHEKFLAPWARQVETQSGGRIRIDLFPSMQLGGAPAQLFDQARDGVADIVWTAPNATAGRFPKIEMFELPFVPSRRALVSSRAIEDFGRANLGDEFREVQPICFSCADRGVVHTNRPVHTFEELKDLRLHVQTRFAGEALRALGAMPVPMPSAQLPLALTQHVVDGCLDPWHMVPTLRLGDLLKAHTDFAESSLSTATFVLVMNKASYDRLPRELKAVIDGNSGQVAAGMAGTMWDLQAAAVADMVAQRGDPITTLLPEAEAHWRKVTTPVVEAWIKDMKEHKVDGGKLLAAGHALLVKYANEPQPQPPQPQQVAEPSQPAQQPAPAKAELTPPAKPDAPVSVSPPPAKPAPMITPTASAAPGPAPAPVKPVATPAHPVAPPPAKPMPATVSAAPPPAPPAASQVPPAAAPAAPVSLPKTLDIPL